MCEKWRKFAKSSTKTNKVPFLRFTDRLGILYGMWNMYVNYNRGIQCMVDLHEVLFFDCSPTTRSRTCICMSGTAG